MEKERLMAIFIGGVMLLSMAGFAVIGLTRFDDSDSGQVQVPGVVKEQLTSEKLISALRSGRVVIRNVYTSNCTACLSRNVDLELFVNGMKGYLVLEEALIKPDNYTEVDGNGIVKFEMVSPTGEIQSLKNMSLSMDSLFDVFCRISAVKPRDCLLRDMARQQPINASIFGSGNATNASANVSAGVNASSMNAAANASRLNETGGNITSNGTNQSV